MPCLGLEYAPPNPVTALVQADRIALARVAAEATPKKGYMRGLGSFYDELSGLGAAADQPYTGNEVIYSPEFTNGTFWDTNTATRRPLVIQTQPGGSGPIRPAVWDGYQYNNNLAEKILKTAKRRREHDNQKYLTSTGRRVGEKPYRNDTYRAYDPCTLGSFVEELSGLVGLGATVPRQGTKAWWVWYATQYLPQYYSQQQIYQYVQQSPYYQYFGSPFGYPVPQQYGYGYQQPQINYGYGSTGYPSYNQYGYLQDPFSQAQYTQYVGEQGSAACAAQGGWYDYTQQSCNYPQNYSYGTSYGTVQSYGPGSSPPNTVGMPYAQAVALLNQYGFNVWLLNLNGISQGVPPGYSQNRVSISVKNGVVDSQAVG